MTVGEVAKKTALVSAYDVKDDKREVKGCYIGDLLSLVMSKAKSADVWITIQGNINVPAVASLTDCAMVIIAEGMKLDENAKKRAEQEGIPVYYSEESAFSLALKVNECL